MVLLSRYFDDLVVAGIWGGHLFLTFAFRLFNIHSGDRFLERSKIMGGGADFIGDYRDTGEKDYYRFPSRTSSYDKIKIDHRPVCPDCNGTGGKKIIPLPLHLFGWALALRRDCHMCNGSGKIS